MVPEAKLEETETGLVPVSAGWFVVNARDARWFHRQGRHSVSLTGKTEWEADTLFPMLGVQLAVLEPGEPNSTYHWETETEAFLVLSGEALLIVEGEERPLRQWDFAHCPPKTEHVVVGAGDGPCVVLAMSSRENQAFGPYGEYTANEVARRYGASAEETTQDGEAADPSWSGVGAVALSRGLASVELGGTEGGTDGQADLRGPHVARRLRGGSKRQFRLGRAGRGSAPLRQRARAGNRHLPLRPPHVRGHGLLGDAHTRCPTNLNTSGITPRSGSELTRSSTRRRWSRWQAKERGIEQDFDPEVVAEDEGRSGE